MRSLSVRRALALGAAASLAAGFLTATSAQAAPAAHLVINEFYGRGGSAGQPYATKFVELYNPTAAAVSLDGLSLQYRSATGTGVANGVTALKGTVASGAYFVVAMNSNGTSGAPLPQTDFTTTLAPSGTTGTIFLATGTAAINPDVTASVIDKLGFGGSNSPETTAVVYGDGVVAPSNSVVGSLNRTNAVDTDNNANDFSFKATVTPGASNTGSSTTPLPVTASIAEIQGTGAASPLAGKVVTTTGVVTAVYPTGGFNGFYLQTPGSGGVAKAAGTASDGIFAFGKTDVTVGACVTVTGTAKEYSGLTELDKVTWVAASDCAPVKPTPLATLPVTDADKEPYEGMLVAPQGTYTITNNTSSTSTGSSGWPWVTSRFTPRRTLSRRVRTPWRTKPRTGRSTSPWTTARAGTTCATRPPRARRCRTCRPRRPCGRGRT